MKKLIFSLVIAMGGQMSQAQLLDDTPYIGADTELSDIPSHSGNFSLEQVPIALNLPNGYIFLDEQTTRTILVNCWGNSADAVDDVFGMIIPNTFTMVSDINRAWFLSYADVGHIKDDQADNMGFTWILNGIKESQDANYTEIKWAWKPEYDTTHHRLSLPLMFINGNDTTLNDRQYVFGKSGMIVLEPLIYPSDIKWLADNDASVANCIEFTNGSRYEDFNPQNQQYAYNSVSAFLKGVPANTGASQCDTPSEDSDTTSFSNMVIGAIAKSAIVLVALMLLLILCVFMTNQRKETSKSILRLSINVLLRISVFAMVYLLILTFGIFLIWAGVWLMIGILSENVSIRSLMAIISGWAIIISFLWAIIKSLFVFKHNEDTNRLEISLSDEPKLMLLIQEVSLASGEAMPKHTYVSPEVNACVFYNNSILGIFALGRKNLVIGLGLLYGLNRQELKAVIAHEYGHFGQKSMRVGQIVSISYNIISNLVNADGASFVSPILRKTFLYVQRGYMTLSRAMEYEADEKSAAIAGSKAAISALCKIEVMSNRFNTYNTLFNGLYESKQSLPESYWSGYEQFLSLSKSFDGINLEAETIASEPLIKPAISRVKLKDPWISHPPIEQRIENIRGTNSANVEYSITGVKCLVTNETYQLESQELVRNAGLTNGSICTDAHYKELLAHEMDERSFPINMRAFFNRDFCEFDFNTLRTRPEDYLIDVFSESNAHVVESFTQAVSDYQTMLMFRNKQISEKEIQYDGKVYNRKTVPIETQLEIVKNLEARVIPIDKTIFVLALTKASDKNLVKSAYDSVFYSQAVIRHITTKMLPLRDSVAKKIGPGGSKSSESFKRIQRILLNFKATMRDLIDKIEMHRLDPVMHVDTSQSIKRVEYDWLLDGDSIDGEEVQYILTLPDVIISQFQSLAYYSKKIISDTIEGKTPLMYWNNSVTSANQLKK